MHSYRINVVEDDPKWQTIISEKIEEAFEKTKMKIDPVLFSSYNTASKALSNNSPWHLLITDYSLSDSSFLQDLGVELCHKANRLGIPSIVLSGKPHVKPDTVRKLFVKYRVLDFFGKENFDRDEFKKVIKREIEKTADAQGKIISQINVDEDYNQLTKTIYDLNSQKLYEIYNFYEVLNPDYISQEELKEYLDSINAILRTIFKKVDKQEKKEAASFVNKIRDLISEDKSIDIKQSIKITLPIIPFILHYHVDIDNEAKFKLNEIWNKMKNKIERFF